MPITKTKQLNKQDLKFTVIGSKKNFPRGKPRLTLGQSIYSKRNVINKLRFCQVFSGYFWLFLPFLLILVKKITFFGYF